MAAIFAAVFAAAVAAVLWVEQPAQGRRRRARRLYVAAETEQAPSPPPRSTPGAMRLSAVPHDAQSSPRTAGRSSSIGAAWREATGAPHAAFEKGADVCVWHDGSLRALAAVHNIVSRLRADAPLCAVATRRNGESPPGNALHVVLVPPGRPGLIPSLPPDAWFLLVAEAGADASCVSAVRAALSGTEAAECVALSAGAEEDDVLADLSRRVRSLATPSLPWASIEAPAVVKL